MTAVRETGRERADSAELLERYRAERDPRDLETLTRRFGPLARKLAARYARGSEPIDDLEQIANLGLVKALQRFEPDRGYAFSSFAVPTILGELRRSFRNTGWALHVPRALQEHTVDVRIATETLTIRLRRAPTVAEIGAESGLGPEDVTEAMGASRAMRALSTDAPTLGDHDEAGGTLLDAQGTVDRGYELVVDRAAIETALPHLTRVQREIVELRFAHDLKQSEIAERLGVSQMQVSRLLRSALERLGTLANHQSGRRQNGDREVPG